MYELLEIEYPGRYRAKLPVTGGQNELNSNIQQIKRLIGGDIGSSTPGGGSKIS